MRQPALRHLFRPVGKRERQMSSQPWMRRSLAQEISSRQGEMAAGEAPSPASIPASIIAKVRAILSHSIVRTFKPRSAVFPAAPEEPIRAELFSVERLEQHGESLAAAQHITPKTDDRPATGEASSRQRPGAARSLSMHIAESIREERTVIPAADWLVDNFHVVDEQVREIRIDLPPGFHRQLPKLRRRTARGISARVRVGLGLRRPHRQPLRPAIAVPVHQRLPACAAVDDRRALGGRDHAPGRARGKPAAPGRAHGQRPRRASSGRCAGRSLARGRRPRGRAGNRRSCGASIGSACRRHSRCSWCNGCAIKIRR